MKNMVYSVLKGVRQSTGLTSGTCELCLQQADASGFLCAPCHQQLSVSHNACSQCAEPMSEPGRCARCQQTPPAFDYAYSSYLYQPPMSSWLLAAKDKTHLQWLLRLGWLMRQKPPHTMDQVDGLIFMPSARKRRLVRGYNPAQLLALPVARQYRLPLYEDALKKTSVADQRGLSASQRRHNQKRSFISGQRTFDGEHLLIIDDVITTGATADAAARLLKQQGAGIVGVWSLCRTPAKSQRNNK